MFILAYCEEESEVVEAILKSAPKLTGIALQIFDTDTVLDIISTVAGPITDQIQPLLGNLVAQQTNGNPFHIAMFMNTIQNEDLLIFDGGTCLWFFSIDNS